jgi:ABC-type Na+ efflux pump permease subunit
VNWRAVHAVARKDLLVVRRSRALMVPLVVVPLLLVVVVPLALMILPVLMTSADPAAAARLDETLRALPPQLVARLDGASGPERWLRLVHGQLLPPLFLLVPFLVAQVIAADGFAGERERKTLEALLYTPTTDGELLAGKLLAALVPALAVDVAAFLLSSAITAAATASLFAAPLLPGVAWLLLAGWVAPAFTALGLTAMLLVSLRVRGTQEAMQLGGLLVLPVVALLVNQVRGALLLGPAALVVGGLLLWGLAGLCLAVGRRQFRRARLVTRL